MKECLIKTPKTGECVLDITKTLEKFDKNCIISRWYDEYRFCTKDGLKATISLLDARYLISKLGLVEHQSPVFNNGSTFKLKESYEER